MDTTLQDPLAGQVLDGRYRIESRLAQGGMATVYRALDTRLERTVALKVMHADLAEDPEFVSRFIREAKAAAGLSHPNVVAVYDQGGDGGNVFLAMEYIEGRTLRDVLRERTRLTPAEAFTVLEPVLAALGAAHAAGLVHRDVKPENVLLANDGQVKVADFGLVRAVSSTTSNTIAGTLLGTVNYLSPEQVRSGAADPRSDVYAAGIVLYEMLTGEKPHNSDNPIHVVYRHVHEDVPPPSELVPGIPPGVDALVALATARDPDRRPADATHLLTELRRVRHGLTEAELGAGGGQATPERAVSSMLSASMLSAPSPVPAASLGPAGRTSNDTVVVPRPPLAAGASRMDNLRRPHQGRGWVAFVIVLIMVLMVSVVAWWLGTGRYVPAPSVLNLTQAQAQAKIRAAGLNPRWRHEFNEVVPRGLVTQTKPKPKARVVRGGSITVYLSDGPERIPVPALAGKSLDDAKKALTDARLASDSVERRFSDSVNENTVIDTDPKPGTTVRPGTPVTLVVSKGDREVDVPDVVGQQADEAVRRLKEDGLQPTIVSSVFSATIPRGAVAEQDPGGNERVERGTTVRLKLSATLEESLGEFLPVPDLKGMRMDKAKRTLEQAGFEHRVVAGSDDEKDDEKKKREVRGQFPGPGTRLPKGTTINLF